MTETLYPALLFLINTLFDLYLFVLVIRVILVYVGANYFDPITQFTVKVTDGIVKPVRRFVPNLYKIEFATLLWIFVIDLIKFFIIALLTFGIPNILGLLVLVLGDVIKIFLQVFLYAILLQAILSWVQPQAFANRLLYQFTAPIMQPMRRYIPPVGGFDISPIPALILLQLLIMLIAAPLMSLGLSMAY